MRQQKQKDKEVDDAWQNEVDLDKLRAQIPKSHEWRQRGPMLVCRSCPNQHDTYIGMNLKLTGIKDGQPILEKV